MVLISTVASARPSLPTPEIIMKPTARPVLRQRDRQRMSLWQGRHFDDVAIATSMGNMSPTAH